MKLTELTKEQEAKMLEVKQYWLNYIFSCKNGIDREKAKKGIEWLYRFSGLDQPMVIFMDSPMTCQLAVACLKEWLRKFPELLDSKQVRSQVWSQVRSQVRSQVWSQVESQVGSQVWSQVGSQVWSQVRSQVRSQVEYETFCAYGSVSDYGWVSFYDFFTQIGVVNHKDFNEFKDLLGSGIYDMIQLKGFCIVCGLPTKIIRNAAGRLHNPNGPSITFADGYSQYYINGRFLPEWIWEKASAGKITREMFLKEQNADIKGGIYGVMGQKGMMELLGAKQVDKQKIVHANGDTETVVLLKTKDKFAEFDNQPMAWVKMICPSTGTVYLQGCEPHHTNAKEAIASLSAFGIEEYSFDMRS